MYSTVEVAKRVGVSKNTLLRWLDEGLTEDVERDWRGWRVWNNEDVERVRAFREAYHNARQRRLRRRAVARTEFARSAASSMARFGRGYLPGPGAVR